jgi:hypothetical protein
MLKLQGLIDRAGCQPPHLMPDLLDFRKRYLLGDPFRTKPLLGNEIRQLLQLLPYRTRPSLVQ